MDKKINNTSKNCKLYIKTKKYLKFQRGFKKLYSGGPPNFNSIENFDVI